MSLTLIRMPHIEAFGSDTGHPKRRVDAARSAGLACTHVSKIPDPSGYWPCKWLRMLARTANSDCSIRHLHGSYGYLSALASINKTLPYVATPMGGDIYYREQLPPNYCLESLMRLALRRADVVTVKSKKMAQRVRELGVSPERTVHLNWGVDTELFQRAASAQDTVLLSPRAMEPLYQIDCIIEAFALLQTPATLLVVDHADPTNSYSQHCHQLVDRLGLSDSVEFIPPQPFEAMPHLYSRALISVSVPQSDGVPQCAYESMSCGTVCVLADLPNYRGVFRHKETAILTGTEPKEIALSIDSLLQDRALLQRISQAGRSYVEEHASLAKNLAVLKELYQSIEGARWRMGWSFWGCTLFLLEPIERKLRKLWQRVVSAISVY